MRFGAIGVTRPENFPKLFNVYPTASSETSRGRITLAKGEKKATVECILSIAKPDEMERYQQMGVHVTHHLLQRGSPQAQQNDILAMVEGAAETRFFRVQTVRDKGGMGIHTQYTCEERGDLN